MLTFYHKIICGFYSKSLRRCIKEEMGEQYFISKINFYDDKYSESNMWPSNSPKMDICCSPVVLNDLFDKLWKTSTNITIA